MTIATCDICPLCKGHFEESTTTFTVDYGLGVIVVRHVPALVCTQCGEAWLEDHQSEKIENLVQEAKIQKHEFKVIDLAA